MAIFSASSGINLINEEEMQAYYNEATNILNILLIKYNICDENGEQESILSQEIKSHYSANGFLQATPLKQIFFNQKQQFVPYEIVQTYQQIISASPRNIKATILNTFLTMLMHNEWIESLDAYLRKYYNIRHEDKVILADLKDYSMGSGVFKVTFLVNENQYHNISVFLKEARGITSYNNIDLATL